MCPLLKRRYARSGDRGRIRLDWLRGKDFVEFELETKCREGFQLRLLVAIDSIGRPRRTEGNSTGKPLGTESDVAGILMLPAPRARHPPPCPTPPTSPSRYDVLRAEQITVIRRYLAAVCTLRDK